MKRWLYASAALLGLMASASAQNTPAGLQTSINGIDWNQTTGQVSTLQVEALFNQIVQIFNAPTIGSIQLQDNGNNQLAFTSGKGIQLLGFGSLQVNGSNGALLGSDGASNDMVVDPSPSVTNVDTDFVLYPPSSAGAWLVVNSVGGANEQQLIIGSHGHSATQYAITQVISGSGSYLPLFLYGGAIAELELASASPLMISLVEHQFNLGQLNETTSSGVDTFIEETTFGNTQAWNLGVSNANGNWYLHDLAHGQFPIAVSPNAGGIALAATLGIPQVTWTDTQTCTAGQISVDVSFIYVCTATNTVKRAAISTF